MLAERRSAKEKCTSFFSFIKSCIPSSDVKKKISPTLSRSTFFKNALQNIRLEQRMFPERERDYSIFPGLNVETEMVVRMGFVYEISAKTMLKIYGASEQGKPLFDSSRSEANIKERDIDPFVNVLCELIPQLLASKVELSALSKNQDNVRAIVESFAFDLLEYDDIDYKVCKKTISDQEYLTRLEDVFSDSPTGNKRWLYSFKNSYGK
jgi:hypothetical protein